MNKAKTVIVKSRVDADLKDSVENKLRLMGVSSAELIRMLYARINLLNKIPFEISLPHCAHIPNEETVAVMNKTDRGEELNDVESIEQLKKELGVDC